MKINKIITNLYASNTFVIEKEGQVLIIDAGAELSKVQKAVGECKVVGVLLTHGHYDHSAYCNEYAKAFDCNIFASQKAGGTMTDERAIYSEDGRVIDDLSRVKFLNEDCILQLGDFSVECITAEGHSPCSMCYKIDDFFFAGDVLFENGIGRTDLVGGNKKQMLATLEKLDNITFDKVFSGHGEESTYPTQKKNISIFKRFLAR